MIAKALKGGNEAKFRRAVGATPAIFHPAGDEQDCMLMTSSKNRPGLFGKASIGKLMDAVYVGSEIRRRDAKSNLVENPFQSLTTFRNRGLMTEFVSQG